jgi:hypothetical protein
VAWNYLTIEIRPEDGGAFSTYGEGGLTREQAHAEIQTILDKAAPLTPGLAQAAQTWRRGAKKDTVYNGLFTWTIYEYPDGTDPHDGATAWLEDYIATIRSQGINLNVHTRKR